MRAFVVAALMAQADTLESRSLSFDAALQEHLREHPAANRAIDGFTPDQRCFLAWAQLWADKTNEGAMRQTLPTDGHPPGVYRMAAPSQHEKAFYEAFGIRTGDLMWLDPSERVKIW